MTITKTPLEKGFEKVFTPLQDFIHDQTTCSLVLIICTISALTIANSPFAESYEAILKTPFGFVLGEWSFQMSLRHWINEGLMTFFFLLLGMEIKREILVGEIRVVQRLIPIISAALGGMLVPAVIYYLFNAGTFFAKGWGIPMATDTAFAVGILALLGKRIPQAAFTFLTALAIIDDLGAILVIAFFYSESISMPHLSVSVLLLGMLILCNICGIRRPVVYLIGGLLAWAAMLGSGIHATVAGILVAITVPARPKQEPFWFVRKTNSLIRKFEDIEKSKDDETPLLGEATQHAVVEEVQNAAEKTTTPLRRWERALEHPVALLVLPIFALANAGISLNMQVISNLWNETLAVGVILGLIIGKGIGIPFFTWLALRLNLGHLPPSINIYHIVGIGFLGGMGFTMSIFISNLGFENMPETLMTAKTGILIASFIAGVSGYLWLKKFSFVGPVSSG
ncbi:Na+/H+ antiporter NhaA [Spartinivicinus ruber]|uniref:Na+/H+ antiporter NhaA n=1 Tax=Spartinivicinus ruber TaxID=2683272 RepID=UPI0013D0C6A7|nr:Na+/H+ antiporter NhaA [Spartinivicinus ruber]